MQATKISNKIDTNATIKNNSKLNKGISKLCTYIKQENTSIGAISMKYNFEEIELRGEIVTKEKNI